MQADFITSQYNFFNSKNKLAIVEDCYVDFRGFVIKDGHLLFDLALEHLVWLDKGLSFKHIYNVEGFKNYSKTNVVFERMVAFNEFVKHEIDESKIIDIEQTTLHLMHPFRDYGYGHFFDTFQKLLTAKSEIFDSIIISNPKKIKDFDVHLRCLNLDAANLIDRPNVGTLIHFKKLIYPYPLSEVCNYQDITYKFLRNKYFKYFNIQPMPDGIKLFLTRGSNINRSINNHESLHQNLLLSNVKIIDGSEPLSEIVYLFSNATHVAGYHGALFVNSIFCGELTKFLEFCPRNRANRCFKDQYRLSDNYIYELIDTDDQFNATLPLDQLLNFYSS
jgi:hypothetical protein